MKRAHTYPAVGRCIYCGADDRRLTTEHIIPESLGGTLLLPASTCDACAAETSAFEGRCTGQIFRPARRILGMPQKNKSRKKKAGPETFDAKVDDVPVKVEVHEFPGLLMSFDFDMPGIVKNEPLTEAFTGRVVTGMLPGFAHRMAALHGKHRVTKGVSLAMPANVDDLGRTLAKIAHAYAVAELGVDGFKPYLLDIILNRPPLHTGHYVGAFGHAPEGEDLHTIELHSFWEAHGVGVEIQLFAPWSMPVYVVIAGEWTGGAQLARKLARDTRPAPRVVR